MAGFDVSRVIAAYTAGQQAKQSEEKRAQAAEDRKYEIEVQKHNLQALKLADKKAVRDEAIQTAGLMEGQQAPEVTAGVSGSTFTPEPQAPEGGVAPIPSPIPASFTRELSLPPIHIPGVSGPDITVQPQSAQERMRQLRGGKIFDAQLKQQENQTVLPPIPALGLNQPTPMDKSFVPSILSQAGAAEGRTSTATQRAGTLAEQTRHNKAMENRPARQAAAAGTSADDPKLIAEAIISGKQPPVLTGLYGKGAAVRAELQRQNYDLATATRDWTAIQKHLAALNGNQQERLRQAVSFTAETLPQIEDAYREWKQQAGISGFKAVNKATLAIMAHLPGPAGSAATNLQALISDFTSELATVYKGGNSSTDEGLKLAALNLNGNWNEKTFTDAIKRLDRSLRIRQNSINNSQPAGVTPGSPYQPPMKTDTSTGPAVGTIEDGHRFKGGNPADPKNWEKVKP